MCKPLLNLAIYFCIFSSLHAADDPKQTSADKPKLSAAWEGNYKLVKYKGREFLVGVRADGEKEYPLVGSRTMTASAYAESVFPMTIESQDSYVIYDKTKKQFIVFNVALCLKGKDTTNNEKTDWVGQIKSSGDHWNGDIVVFRKYDKKGTGMKAPYYSMGRDFPMKVNDDGSCTVQYNYFGDIKFKLDAREVKDELLQQIIDNFDQHYHERADADK